MTSHNWTSCRHMTNTSAAQQIIWCRHSAFLCVVRKQWPQVASLGDHGHLAPDSHIPPCCWLGDISVEALLAAPCVWWRSSEEDELTFLPTAQIIAADPAAQTVATDPAVIPQVAQQTPHLNYVLNYLSITIYILLYLKCNIFEITSKYYLNYLSVYLYNMLLNK